MKINLEQFAEKCAEFAGLPSKARGLAELFRIVEREAFCDGVRAGRSSSLALDPAEMHDVYAKALSPLAAKGGRARAAKLSPERRREIASTAAKQRWSSTVKDNPVAVAVPESAVTDEGA